MMPRCSSTRSITVRERVSTVSTTDFSFACDCTTLRIVRSRFDDIELNTSASVPISSCDWACTRCVRSPCEICCTDPASAINGCTIHREKK